MENNSKILKSMECVKLGNFSTIAAADVRRIEFNCKNEQIVSENIAPDLLFIGDSITHNFELGAYFKGYYCVNRGISGDKLEFIKRRFFADAVALRPKKIILLGGINDVMTIVDDNWYKIKGNDPKIVIDGIKENISEIVKLCKNENCKIFICSLLPVTLSEIYMGNLVNETITKVNINIQKICLNFDLDYVDYFSEFNKNKTIRGLSVDGLHPNAEGYKTMTNTLMKYIR